MLDHRVSAPCPTRLGWNPQTQDLLCAVPQKFWNQTIWFRILSDLFIIYIYIILHTVSSKIKLNKDTVSTHIYMYIHIYIYIHIIYHAQLTIQVPQVGQAATCPASSWRTSEHIGWLPIWCNGCELSWMDPRYLVTSCYWEVQGPPSSTPDFHMWT